MLRVAKPTAGTSLRCLMSFETSSTRAATSGLSDVASDPRRPDPEARLDLGLGQNDVARVVGVDGDDRLQLGAAPDGAGLALLSEHPHVSYRP